MPLPSPFGHAAHRQGHAAVRFDWGPAGAAALVGGADVSVVIDVLSFTTTTTVALEAGATVLPLPWRDDRAETFARERDAVLAVGRSRADGGQVSLSPASMRANARAGERIVLPSPNGATIAHRLAGTICVAGCLRNAAAVARWLHESGAGSIAVVAAGERWPDDSLRPAAEDLWGAGAVIARLHDLGQRDLSPEAELAQAAYLAVDEDLSGALRACASGRELIGAGFQHDVAIAADVDVSPVVPVLRDGEFVDATLTA